MRLAAHSRLTRTKIKTESDSWESQLAWRLARMYEQRLNTESNGSSKTANKLEEDIKALLPFDSEKDTFTAIDRVRRIALPSVLESLQVGFERTEYQKQGTALSDGLPDSVLNKRQIRLSYQHRMHPDIAEFSRVHIYHEKALQSLMAKLKSGTGDTETAHIVVYGTMLKVEKAKKVKSLLK